ncbi:MAG TPA: tRNA (adenosine(37)-N6)-dimethylallyltransferase MiaA [Bdellovibrionota bacterium]|jgi:tRNA dimethylallyltransferase
MSVWVIAGPTASGKSALALKLARQLRKEGKETEIICADSVTVYKGLEIGAAKPGKEERGEFTHHLLDVCDPRENFTAGDFVRLALPAIVGIQYRKALPLLVGGTGFYLRALLRGMASNEEEDTEKSAAIKARLEKRAEAEGYEALHKEVLRLDPGSASTVHPNDHYRVIRALQAMELYGKPWSELNKHARSTGFRFPDTRFFCLDVDRELLKQRIELRTQKMIEAGLMDEVRGLLGNGVPPSAKPLQSVGYKECVETLNGSEPESTLAERIVQSTMKLAKQQRTWFKGEAGVEWLKEDYWANLEKLLLND